MLFGRVEVSLYIIFFLFSFHFSFVSRFSFLILDKSSDLNWDSKLDECKSSFNLCLNFNGIWEFSLNSFFFSFDYNFNEFD